jgi:hypothetical protein
LSEIGAISERRIATLVDPALNFGLPPFLTPDPGINSGFMIAEVTAAALYAENKQRALACSIDSTPTSANQEDHVSMAAHAARRLSDMADNLACILGIELLVAAQGIALRAPHTTSPALAAVVATLREQVPALVAIATWPAISQRQRRWSRPAHCRPPRSRRSTTTRFQTLPREVICHEPPTGQRPHDPRATWIRDQRQELADGGAAPNADEQSRS